jgi:hypothetical protein
MSSTRRFDWTGLVARLLFSFLVVFSLYNPSGYSFWHWLWVPGLFWVKCAIGIALLGVHILLWRSVVSVLRPWGVALAALVGASGFAALSSTGAIDHADPGVIVIALLAGLAVLMTLGLSLALIMHRLTGVQHVEEVPH